MKRSVNVVINSSKSKVWQATSNIENSAAMVQGIVALKVINKPDNGLIGLK